MAVPIPGQIAVPNAAPPVEKIALKKKRDGSFDDIIHLFLSFIWVDDPVNCPVAHACNACELPHVDSAGDGFADEEFTVLFRHRLKSRQITAAQLLQGPASVFVGHSPPFDSGMRLDVACANVDNHFAQFIPWQSGKKESPGTYSLIGP